MIKTKAEWRALKPFINFARGNREFLSEAIKEELFLKINPAFNNITENIIADHFKVASKVTEVVKKTPEYNQQCFDYSVSSSILKLQERSFTQKSLPSNFHEICTDLLLNHQNWEDTKSFLDNRPIGPQVYDPKRRNLSNCSTNLYQREGSLVFSIYRPNLYCISPG
jgi:hypothetical protein